MIYNTTVTQKGQITLRKELRDMLGIKSYEKVNVSLAKDHIKIKPIPHILSLAGKFPIKKGKSVLEARKYMETHYKRV